MQNIWKKRRSPSKFATIILAIVLAALLLAGLFMTVWGSLDVSTDIILSFESGEIVSNIKVDVNEEFVLPDTLRAIIKIDDDKFQNISEINEEDDEAIDLDFVPMNPIELHGYEYSEDYLYYYISNTEEISYRVYGTYKGSAPSWFSCDEAGNINGVIKDISVLWVCEDYEKDNAGEYVFNAEVSGYEYIGPQIIALVTVQDDVSEVTEEDLQENEEVIDEKINTDIDIDNFENEEEIDISTSALTVHTVSSFAEMQSAVQNAESGDVISVIGDIVFEVPISIEKSLTFESANNSFDIIFSSSKEYRHFKVSENCTLTFKNISLVGNRSNGGGGGIEIENGNQLTLENPVITKCLASGMGEPAYGAIYVGNNSVLNINGGTINNNGLRSGNELAYGAAIYASNGATINLDNVDINNNISKYGGAIYLCENSLMSINNSNIYSNEALENGGVIFSSGNNNNVTIKSGNIYDNKAKGYGGAIYFVGQSEKNSNLKIKNNSKIQNNKASSGAGVYVINAKLAISNSSIIENKAEASNARGGGIYASDLIEGIIDSGSEILNNSSKGNFNGGGGGIYVEKSLLTIYEANILENEVDGSGAGIYAYNKAIVNIEKSNVSYNIALARAGGVFSTDSKIVVNDSKILSNKVNSAGDGCGFYINNGTELIFNSGEIKNNEASMGGGICAEDATSTITVNGGLISENKGIIGAGIYIQGATLDIKGGQISNNVATNNGGAVYSKAANIYVSGGEMYGNSAASSGGAISISNGILNVSDGHFYHNTSANGGAINGYKVEININGGKIEKNSVTDRGGGIYFEGEGSSVKVSNGEIIENSVTGSSGAGGGIYGDAKLSTVVVSGGTISNNTASSAGGGIYFRGITGSIKISGGKISENKIVKGTGGGVYILSLASATVSDDASITGNEAVNAGGIYALGITGTFEISGGEISQNRVTLDSESSAGGGVYITSSPEATVKITGGKIYQNICSGKARGGGIFVSSVKNLIVASGEIAENKANFGGGIYATNISGLFEMNGGKINENEADRGAGVYLNNIKGLLKINDGEIANNKSLNTSTNGLGGVGLYVEASTNAVLEINGGKISSNTNAGSAGGSGVCVNNINGLVISGGEISYNTTKGVGAGIYASNVNNILVDGDSKILNNTAGSSGGGIYVFNVNSVNINSGDISQNISEKSNGGGIYLSGNGTTPIFNISGGRISGNKANIGGGLYIQKTPNVNLTGGEIISNTSNNKGGGISVSEVNDITIDGCKVLNNKAVLYGGGMCIDGQNTRLTVLSGEITDNEVSGENSIGGGIYTPNIFGINVTPTNSEDVVFSGNKATKGYRIAPEDIATHNSLIQTQYFSAFTENYTFQYAYNNYDIGYVKNAQVFNVKFDSQGGSLVSSIVSVYGEKLTVPNPEPTKNNYIFDGWYKEPECINKWDFSADTITNNITLYAKWAEPSLITIANEVSGSYINKSQEFTYTLYFMDNEENPLPAGTKINYIGSRHLEGGVVATMPLDGTFTLDEDGKASIKLTRSQAITISEIKKESKIRVVQTPVGGYNTSIGSYSNGSNLGSIMSADTGVLGMEIHRYIIFKNVSTIVPAGISTGNSMGPIILVLGILLILITSLIMYNRKRHINKESFKYG